MAVVADFGVDVEVVEHAELTGQRVRVGRDLLAEEDERRIGVAAIEIAEYLIERAVLANDVEHVLDRRRIADAARNWRCGRRVRRRQAVFVGVRRYAPRQLRQLL